MKNKRNKKPVKPAKAGELKSSFPDKARKNGHVSLAEARAFLKETIPNHEGKDDAWHTNQILEFWSKPYHDLALMFKQHQCDRGLERRVLDVAREDIQRLLQILYKGGINYGHQ